MRTSLSSFSVSASNNFSRHAVAASAMSSGTSSTRIVLPASSASKYSAFMPIRSTTPSNGLSLSFGDPAPMGMATGTGRPRSRRRIDSSVAAKFAPTTSILLTNTMRGTAYLLACRHTVSDCASTPFWASKTTTAPSRTRRLRSTSAVKSTWPGVSMRLIVQSRQVNGMQAL